MKQGIFVISLDFELAWGIRDTISPVKYRDNLVGVHEVIPKLLDIFVTNNIHVTFATVGFLMARNKSDLIQSLPEKKPEYKHQILSPYKSYIDELEESGNDQLHFAPELVELIRETSGMEIGTHTFSHYYCLEEGQTLSDFRADLKSAVEIASKKSIELRSLVFPRNQLNKEYLKVCEEMGIRVYRGNENSWLHAGDQLNNIHFGRRACRLVDSYFNLSGYHTHKISGCESRNLIDIPSSRFLRPYQPSLHVFESLRLKRITKAMTHAAINGELFHLWWHPHNFGIHQTQNLQFLSKIISHFKMLRERYHMQSLNMAEAAETIVQND